MRNINPNTLLDPVDSAWSITSVGTISNGGSMLAMARLGADPVTQLVRLVPVRSPDLDGNGSVDGADLGILLSAWGSGPGTADLNLDGEVDGGDLGALLAGWGG